MGESPHDMRNKAEWVEMKKDPRKVQFPGEEILKHDSHKFAEDKFDRVGKRLDRRGTLREFDDPEYMKRSKTPVDQTGVVAELFRRVQIVSLR